MPHSRVDLLFAVVPAHLGVDGQHLKLVTPDLVRLDGIEPSVSSMERGGLVEIGLNYRHNLIFIITFYANPAFAVENGQSIIFDQNLRLSC